MTTDLIVLSWLLYTVWPENGFWLQHTYSWLLPCRHPAITDTPIIWTTAKSQAKMNYTCLTGINSCYEGLSLMRALTQHVCKPMYLFNVRGPNLGKEHKCGPLNRLNWFARQSGFSIELQNTSSIFHFIVNNHISLG